MTNILISGAAGKMGTLSAETIAAQEDLRLVALVDPKAPAHAGDVAHFTSIPEALASTSPDAALEFSVPAVVYQNSLALLEAGVPTVIGATGLGDEQVRALGDVAAAGGTALLIVPNFALGAVLLMQFASQAAKYFPHGEIVELHGATKIDSPSGTSLRTAQMMAASRTADGVSPPGAGDPARGIAVAGTPIHSVRLPGLVAHQEVLFADDDELLTLRHDSLSRRSFMSGVLLAMRKVTSIKGTVIGLENLLD